jgi:hypothetical protein
MARQTEQIVEVQATAMFKTKDGRDVRVGERLEVTLSNALDLIAAGFVIKPHDYKDRAMRSSSR